MNNETQNNMNNNQIQRWYLREGEWRQVQRPPPVQIPALPAVAAGGGPVTPPAFQPRENAPPAPRAARRRPILNPEDESDDENQPPAQQPSVVRYSDAFHRALAVVNDASTAARGTTERRKLLQNALSALNALGEESSAITWYINNCREALATEYGL